MDGGEKTPPAVSPLFKLTDGQKQMLIQRARKKRRHLIQHNWGDPIRTHDGRSGKEPA
jgi:hypothetical protein